MPTLGPYLAPCTEVLLLNMNFSNNTYRPAGNVESAAIHQRPSSSMYCIVVQSFSRLQPLGSQRKLSRTSTEKRSAQQRPMLRLKPLHQRYKRQGVEEHVEEAEVYERVRVQSVHCEEAHSSQHSTSSRISASHLPSESIVRYALDPNPTCAGTSAAHAMTFHAVCSSNIHSKTMMNRTMRVKRGRRKR